MKRTRGFTLLELIVALAIFAVIAALAYGALNSALQTRRHTEEQATRLTHLQLAFAMLARDVEQIAPRAVRGESGEDIPVVVGGSGSLEFTRAGWSNPAQRARSSLQHVAYAVHDGHWQRLAWRSLDRAPGDAAQEMTLLSEVRTLEVRFLDNQQLWQLQWPTAADAQAQTLLPRAIEVTVDIAGIGRITRLLRVPRQVK